MNKFNSQKSFVVRLLVAIVAILVVGGKQVEAKTEKNIQPSITLLSPNGGEQIMIGDTITIKYRVSSVPSGAFLQFVLSDRDSGSGSNNIIVLNVASPVKGKFSFTYELTGHGEYADYTFDSIEDGAYKLYAILYEYEPAYLVFDFVDPEILAFDSSDDFIAINN